MSADADNSKIIRLIRERTDEIASMPALLLCAVTLLMLVLDIILPSMSSMQYMVYPLLIKLTGLISIICAGCCYVADQYDRRFRVGAETVFFATFIILMIISTIVNGISRDAVFGVKYRYVGVYDIILFMAVYMYCPAHIRSEKWKERILLVYMAVADGIAVAFIIDEMFDVIEAFHGMLEPGAIFFHGNHYGYYMTIAILISAGFFLLRSGKLMAAGAASLILNLAALEFNRTMGAFLASGAALMFFAVYTILKKRARPWKPWSIILVPSFIIAVALVLSSALRSDVSEILLELSELAHGVNDMQAGNGRWGIWQFTLDLIVLKPLLGYGCEEITIPFRLYTLTESPHNEVLTYAMFFGIPAALAYTAGVIFSIIKGIRMKSVSDSSIIAVFAAAAYFMSSLLGVAMFYTAPFLFVMLGLCVSGSAGHIDKRGV